MARISAYAAAMGKLHQDYPEDVDGGSGSSRPEIAYAKAFLVSADK